jgi:hypothetical protein
LRQVERTRASQVVADDDDDDDEDADADKRDDVFNDGDE